MSETAGLPGADVDANARRLLPWQPPQRHRSRATSLPPAAMQRRAAGPWPRPRHRRPQQPLPPAWRRGGRTWAEETRPWGPPCKLQKRNPGSGQASKMFFNMFPCLFPLSWSSSSSMLQKLPGGGESAPPPGSRRAHPKISK